MFYVVFDIVLRIMCYFVADVSCGSIHDNHSCITGCWCCRNPASLTSPHWLALLSIHTECWWVIIMLLLLHSAVNHLDCDTQCLSGQSWQRSGSSAGERLCYAPPRGHYAMMMSDVCRVYPGGVWGQPAGWHVLDDRARPAWLKAAAAGFRCRLGRGHIVAAARPPTACYYSLIMQH